MSYSIKYRTTYRRLSGSFTTIDILQSGWGGGITNLIAGGTPLTINTAGDCENIFKSTIGSGVIITVVATPQILTEFFTNDPQKYRVNIYNGESGSNLIWQGFVNSNIYSEDNSQKFTETHINCNDGMAVLDSLYYRTTGGTAYTGLATIGAVLNNALNKLNLTFSNVYTSNDISLSDLSTNIFTNLKVDNQNYVNESFVSNTCRETLDSILGFGLVMRFKANSIYIYDPINLSTTSKGKVYTLPNFSESSTAVGGIVDITGGTLSFLGGQQLDIIAQCDEVDVKYDPYNFINYSYDFNKNLANAGGWGHVTNPSEWYNNSTVTFSGWTQSSGSHFVGAKETDKGDPTYMLWLTNNDINNEPVLTLNLPTISLYKDSTLSIKISFDCWFQTKENNWNIFSPAAGNQVYGYYVQTSIKIGNQYYNVNAWTTGFTHNLIPVISCTNAQYGTKNSNSTVNDTWITASTIIPLDNSLVGSENIVFCVYDYWDGSQAVTTRKNFSPVIGILLKNLNISVINTNTGKQIDNSGILKRGNISTNYIYKTNVNTINTTNGTGVYGVSKGAYRDTSSYPITSMYRGGYYTTEQLLIQSFISQYKQPRAKLSTTLNVKNYLLDIWLKLVKDSKYFTGKQFYICSSTYNDKYETMQVEMVEITATRDSL